MQNAEVILSILSQKSIQNSCYVFDRLYRNLFNPDMYALAFRDVCALDEAVSQDGDDGVRSAFSLAMMQDTIDLLRREAYYPLSLHVQSVSTKDALADVPGRRLFLDRLVQAVIRMLLQAIYEPLFMDTSHGFRPGRSYHTALLQARTAGKGTNWAIAGNIEDLFGAVHPERLRSLLAKKISDGRFLNLIDRFLAAGYMDICQARTSFVGVLLDDYTLAPVLANIYFHELDVHMQNLCAHLSAGNTRLADVMSGYRGDDHSVYVSAPSMQNESSQVPSDHRSTGVCYVRYADAFIAMVAGSRDVAEQVQHAIRDFMESNLACPISYNKMNIIHLLDQKARFLGYEITRSRGGSHSSQSVPDAKKHLGSATIQLLVPADVIREKLKPFVANGKPVHHKSRLNLPLLAILQLYNEEIRSLYQYYCQATDVSTKIGKFKYYHYTSLVKTVARKENVSIARIIRAYGVDVKRKQGSGTSRIFGISYMTKDGPQILTYFHEPIRFCLPSA